MNLSVCYQIHTYSIKLNGNDSIFCWLCVCIWKQSKTQSFPYSPVHPTALNFISSYHPSDAMKSRIQFRYDHSEGNSDLPWNSFTPNKTSFGSFLSIKLIIRRTNHVMKLTKIIAISSCKIYHKIRSRIYRQENCPKGPLNYVKRNSLQTVDTWNFVVLRGYTKYGGTSNKRCYFEKPSRSVDITFEIVIFLYSTSGNYSIDKIETINAWTTD